MKILVFATDITPIKGLPTSGTAIRTYGLAEGLRSHGHDVTISIPRTALAGLKKSTDISSLPAETQSKLLELEKLSFDSLNQRKVLHEINPDVILCGHWPAMTMRLKPSQALVIDLAGPHLLERYYQKSPEQKAATLGKLDVLATADYFIVSGPSQRLYFLSFLIRSNVQRPEARIATITMPLNPLLPKRSEIPASDYPHFIFGGVFLPWQDPSFGLNQLSSYIAEKNKGHLTLVGGKHPNYEINLGSYQELFDSLSKNQRVTKMPMQPFDNFINEMLSKHVAIDLMQWNLERLLSVNIRTTTFLWAGLPVIYNNYSDLSPLINLYDAGWCIETNNASALRETLDSIYHNQELTRQKSINAQRLAREIFSWDMAITPLLNLLGTKQSVNIQETDIAVDFPDDANFPIYRDHPIEQQFTCRINGLKRIECRMATHGRDISKPVKFRLYAYESKDTKKLLAEQVGDKSNLENNEWFALELEPISNSAGKTFALEIQADNTEEHESISPWAIKSSPYPLTKLLYANANIKDKCLCLRTTCIRTN
jgi:hypothetical protein